MKCFYDPTQDAVGSCKSCGKGLSLDYAVDLGKGLACKNRCEDDVRALIALIDNNVAMRATSKQLIEGSGRAGIITSVFYLLVGATFLMTGLIFRDKISIFPIVLGSLFVVWSLFGFFRSRAIQRAVADAGKRSR